MAAIPTLEKPPGLREPWLGIWRATLTDLKASGAWRVALRPILDEYVYALRGASNARAGFAWLNHLEDAVASEEVDWQVLSQIAAALPAQWDRDTRRASALADQLALTPRGRKAGGLGGKADKDKPEPKRDSFEALDELAPRRSQTA